MPSSSAIRPSRMRIRPKCDVTPGTRIMSNSGWTIVLVLGAITPNLRR